MRRRRGYTHAEAIGTVTAWLERKGMSQRAFIAWLDGNGIVLSPGYLNDILKGNTPPGPRFVEAFKAITGVQLEAGLVESDKE